MHNYITISCQVSILSTSGRLEDYVVTSTPMYVSFTYYPPGGVLEFKLHEYK